MNDLIVLSQMIRGLVRSYGGKDARVRVVFDRTIFEIMYADAHSDKHGGKGYLEPPADERIREPFIEIYGVRFVGGDTSREAIEKVNWWVS